MNNMGFLCGSLSPYKFLDYSGTFENNEPLILTYSPTIGTSSPFASDTTYTNCIVDWGDGSIVEYGSTLATHDFTSEDDVTIRVIFEELTRFRFENTSKLKKIDGCLNGCEGLTELTNFCYQATNLTYLSTDLFKNCVNVESMTSAFQECLLSEFPTLPANLKSACWTFYKCKNLTKYNSITCPLVNMAYMFEETGLVEAPNIPSTVTDIDGAFRNTKIESMPYLENTSIELMNWTFANCPNLTYTTRIPDTVTSMKNTFTDCTKLIAFTNFSSNLENMLNTFIGCTSLVTVPEIPSSVKYLDGTFSGCSSLTEMPTLNEGVESMIQTFLNCTSLIETKKIPSTVTNFSGTFDGCENLCIIMNYPENVINMSFAFNKCYSLYDIPLELPSTATNLCACFSECSHIGIAPKITGVAEDVSFIFNGCERMEYLSNEVLPSTVTNISCMCQGCTSLQEVLYTLHSELTNISGAFCNCCSASNATINVLCNITDETMLNGCFGGYGIYNSDDQITTLNFTSESYTTATLLDAQSEHVAINSEDTLSCLGTEMINALTDGICNKSDVQYVQLSDVSYVINSMEYEENAVCVNTITVPTSQGLTKGYLYVGLDETNKYDIVIQALSNSCVYMPTDCSSMFEDMDGLTSVYIGEEYSFINTTTVERMFSGCVSLVSVYIHNGETMRNSTTMSRMFNNCSSLLDIKTYNIDNNPISVSSACVDTSYIFYNCISLNDINYFSFNTVNVTNFSYMFYKFGYTNMTTFELPYGFVLNDSVMVSKDNMFAYCGYNEMTYFNLNNFGYIGYDANHMFKSTGSCKLMAFNNLKININTLNDAEYMLNGTGVFALNELYIDVIGGNEYASSNSIDYMLYDTGMSDCVIKTNNELFERFLLTGNTSTVCNRTIEVVV